MIMSTRLYLSGMRGTCTHTYIPFYTSATSRGQPQKQHVYTHVYTHACKRMSIHMSIRMSPQLSTREVCTFTHICDAHMSTHMSMHARGARPQMLESVKAVEAQGWPWPRRLAAAHPSEGAAFWFYVFMTKDRWLADDFEMPFV